MQDGRRGRDLLASAPAEGGGGVFVHVRGRLLIAGWVGHACAHVDRVEECRSRRAALARAMARHGLPLLWAYATGRRA